MGCPSWSLMTGASLKSRHILRQIAISVYDSLLPHVRQSITTYHAANRQSQSATSLLLEYRNNNTKQPHLRQSITTYHAATL